MSPISCSHLYWSEIAAGRDFHAAQVVLQAARGQGVALHDHDFCEVMLVTQGGGLHRVNGAVVALRPRDLIWMRPADRHAISTGGGQRLHYINIAWRSELWTDFIAYAGLREQLGPLQRAALPPVARIAHGMLPSVQRLMDELLCSHLQLGTTGAPPCARLQLTALWSCLLPLWLQPRKGEITASQPGPGLLPNAVPPWLASACNAMHGDNLQMGLPRLVELSGVSGAHLGRTLKAAGGLTPTQWIAARRIDQAAMLLGTTPEAVAAIALDCGYNNLSNFHRAFKARHGLSPRRYRLQRSRAVAP